ncbi:VOC family protein [Anaerosinus massiliensis]|uniref:VOC family protein n=1 Tax=Massilibacillus massiliensis TaxID=1806837 RepID=UPI000DA60727|nr:VOC family protein [Massilibacillus massiliensis]
MRLGAIVLDSDNIEELSDFYASMLGWTKSSQIHEEEKWITVIKADYSETPLIFQENPDYSSPKWPSNKDEQQQMIHLDFYVRMDEFESKIEHAIQCGAKIAESQFSNRWKVMIDIAGHPFCIIPIPKDIYEQRYR